MRILLIDTCGEVGSVALAKDACVIGTSDLPARTASSALLIAVRTLLQENDWQKNDLDTVGVVSGPGSFTGVRVGLAAAQGLCEALQLPLAAVSRLAVLAEVTGLTSGFAVLDAGRSELYVRDVGASEDREYLCTREEFLATAIGHKVVIAEQRLVEPLSILKPEVFSLNASDSLPLVLRMLRTDGARPANIDANYVRTEQQIYGRSQPVPQDGK